MVSPAIWASPSPVKLPTWWGLGGGEAVLLPQLWSLTQGRVPSRAHRGVHPGEENPPLWTQ